MKRRGIVSVLAASLVGITGCTGRSFRGSADEQPSTTGQTTTPERTTTPTLSIAALTLQPGVVSRMGADYVGVSDGAEQFLYLDVTVDEGTPPSPGSFRFRFDGETYAPVDDLDGLWKTRTSDPYTEDEGAGWLLFRLPETGEATTARLEWSGGEWQPGAALRQRLLTPSPPMSASMSVPETMRSEEKPAVTVRVTNDGSVAGRFVAGLNRSGPNVAQIPVGSVSVAVPAGETVERTVDDGAYMGTPAADDVGDDDPDVTYTLDWTGGRVSRELRLVP